MSFDLELIAVGRDKISKTVRLADDSDSMVYKTLRKEGRIMSSDVGWTLDEAEIDGVRAGDVFAGGRPVGGLKIKRVVS